VLPTHHCERDSDHIAATRLGKQDLRADALAVQMLDQLRTATPTQVGNYVDNNVTDLASARMLKRIILVMALIAKDES